MEKRAAIIGCGRVGRNWALLFLRAGWSVRVFDPDRFATDGLVQLAHRLAKAEPEYQSAAARLSIHDTLSETVEGVEWIQESAPDRLDLKRKIYQKVQVSCPIEAVIASSSKSFGAHEIQACAVRPKFVLVVRPLTEGFETPRVAVMGGVKTHPDFLAGAAKFLRSVGLDPEINSGR